MAGVVGCSSSSPASTGAASTTAPSGSSITPGSSVVATAGPFCTAWDEARRAGAAIDTAGIDPTVVKAEVAAALAATKAAAALAPADFADLAAKSVAQEEAVVALLEKYDYSFAALTSEEGKALVDSADYIKVTDDRNAYLQKNCGLAPNQTTAGQAGVVLSPGDDGIRQLFQLLQIGGQLDISDDQIDCLVDALSGKISDADLQAIGANGSVSDSGTAAFVEALSTCGVVPTAG
ncbi:MAG: hypothetical protein JWL72_3650 [Ilumatobacteraceae bacterium]|nr:hypothetical protein [Ilumatobacteraceae bacterium]